MAIKIEVLGKRDLDALARRCRNAANKGVKREMDQGLREAGDAIGHGIRDATDIYMPRGYETTFSRSLVIKTEVRHGVLRGVSLSARAFGRRGHDRQVEELERGRLKHPFWGRWVSSPRAWQRIRPGWFSEPARFALPAAMRKIDRAAGRVAASIGNRP